MACLAWGFRQGSLLHLKGAAPAAASTQTRLPPQILPSSLTCSYKAEFDEAGKHNEVLAANLSKVVDDLHPVRVLQLFSAIPEEVRAGWDSPIGRTAWV